MKVKVYTDGMKSELSKFRIKPGTSRVVDEWMDMLSKNLPLVLATLEGEKIYVESIFRGKEGKDEFLYWYSIGEPGGDSVAESTHEVDKRHLEYWKQCIDTDYVSVITEQVTMVSSRVNITKF